MANKEKSVPVWILVVAVIMGLLQLFVSSSLVFSPQTVLKTVDLGAKGVTYLSYMWAARQLALGFIFLFATLKRSVPMLTIAFVFFFVMNVGDLFVGISQGDNSLIIGAGIVCVLTPIVIYFLNKKTE